MITLPTASMGLLMVLFFVFYFFYSAIKILREYERGVVFRLGRLIQLKGPGIVIILPFGIGALLITKYASVGSLTAATLFPIVMGAFVFTGIAPLSYFILSIIVCVLIYAVHIPNIERLRAGNERRFGARLGQKPTQQH